MKINLFFKSVERIDRWIQVCDSFLRNQFTPAKNQFELNIKIKVILKWTFRIESWKGVFQTAEEAFFCFTTINPSLSLFSETFVGDAGAFSSLVFFWPSDFSLIFDAFLVVVTFTTFQSSSESKEAGSLGVTFTGTAITGV